MGHLSDPPCDDIGQNIAVPFPGVDCKKEHLVSISYGKLVPIEVEKNWLGSNPSHSQLVIKAADDLQTMEQVPATQKTHTRFHSSSHSGNLSSQRGRVG